MYVSKRGANLVAIDRDRRSVTARLSEQDCTVEEGGRNLFEGDIRYGTDTKRRVETDEIRTAPVTVTVIRLDEDRNPIEHTDLVSGDSARLDDDAVAIVRTPVLLLLRSDTPATIRRTDGETLIEFDDTADVTLGFQNRDDRVDGIVEVRRTVDGVARALSTLGCAIPVTSPDRTWPNLRKYPPRIEFVNERAETVDHFDRPETNTEVVVSEEGGLDALLPTAALIHYLGATATVEEDADAHVRAGSSEFSLGDDPEEIDRTASQYLKRVFFLDCHARSAGPHGKPLSGGVLETLGLSAEYLYDAPLDERVRTYLSLPEEKTESLADTLPEWHLGVHVQPEFENVPSFTHHLSRLADIYRPESASLRTPADRGEWGEAQKEEGLIRGTSPHAEGDVMVDPADRAGTVGWQAPRRALGAFNVVSRGVPRERPLVEDDISVTVVLAESTMTGENVANVYRKRDLPLEAKFVSSPTKNVLTELFEEQTDLVHYIGHHEPDGLQCEDGWLSAAEIDECGAQAFFLNACGSLPFGEQLVKKGAAAGAVTTRAVYDEFATSVGIDWAQLVSLGWSVERALDYARVVSDPSGYVTVGDGAHVVAESDTGVPPKSEFKKDKVSGNATLSLSYGGPQELGSELVDGVTEETKLTHTTREYELSGEELRKFFSRLDSPTLYKDGLFWNPEELI
jgi:hypothetical protein